MVEHPHIVTKTPCLPHDTSMVLKYIFKSTWVVLTNRVVTNIQIFIVGPQLTSHACHQHRQLLRVRSIIYFDCHCNIFRFLRHSSFGCDGTKM